MYVPCISPLRMHPFPSAPLDTHEPAGRSGAMSSAASPLLRCVEQREATVQLQLICFPHAGGSASSYNTWTSLPDIIEVWVVQPPACGKQMSCS